MLLSGNHYMQRERNEMNIYFVILSSKVCRVYINSAFGIKLKKCNKWRFVIMAKDSVWVNYSFPNVDTYQHRMHSLLILDILEWHSSGIYMPYRGEKSGNMKMSTLIRSRTTVLGYKLKKNTSDSRKIINQPLMGVGTMINDLHSEWIPIITSFIWTISSNTFSSLHNLIILGKAFCFVSNEDTLNDSSLMFYFLSLIIQSKDCPPDTNSMVNIRRIISWLFPRVS